MSQVGRLALGTAAFGLRQYGLSTGHQPSHAEAADILRYAFEHGIRWFDTGAAYGDAEDLLRFYPFGKSKLVTKLAPDLVRMGAERDGGIFDVVLLHNPTVGHLADTRLLKNLSQAWALEHDGEEGPRGKIGASVYTPEEAHQAISAGLSVIQIPYHVLDQRHRLENIFCEAKAAGVTVMARQPWARGLLLSDPNTFRDRGFGVEWWRAVIVYQRICRQHGLTPLEAGLRFSLESTADLVVFGVSSLAQLQQVIAIAEADPPDSWRSCYQELRTTFRDSALTLGSVCTPGR